MSAWILTLDGKNAPVDSLDHLREALQRRRSAEFDDIWLAHEDGRSLNLLRNNDRAILMFLRDREGDPGMTSRNRSAFDATPVRYRLSNGQVDEYPGDWALTAAAAFEALERFYVTTDLPDTVSWHQD